jgi:murein DD-endopeptidase MepM/ murein hydrolase activator NlpD
MRELPLVLGTGAAAAAVGYYLWRRDRDDPRTIEPAKPEPTRHEPPEGRWVWPVGVWQDRKPEISNGFDGSGHTPSGAIIPHGGVDIMYRRKPGDAWKPGTPNATARWVMPDHRAALAASDGVVWSAAFTARGGTVVIDHAPRKLATYYTHMSTLLVAPKQAVRAGTPIGVVGADPLDGQHLMHLHFEIWRGGAADRFDPQPLMETAWEYLPDPGDLPRPDPRNGRQRDRDAAVFTVPVTSHYRRPPRR